MAAVAMEAWAMAMEAWAVAMAPTMAVATVDWAVAMAMAVGSRKYYCFLSSVSGLGPHTHKL